MDMNSYLKEKKEVIDAIIETHLPRKYKKESMEKILGKEKFSFDTDAVNGAVAEPVWDFLDRGGKRWRPALFLLLTEALEGNTERVKRFTALIELVHNGTIIVDDIEDDSSLRRGKECLHKIYGEDIAINVGNAVYFIPLKIIMDSEFDTEIKERAFEIYAEEMINLHFGQAMDIFWHKGKKEMITEQQYLQMVSFKTGTLARFAARLAALLAGAEEETQKTLGTMAETIGIGFQIQDDILDITAEKREKFGKVFGNDITEGKRSLMIIHVLEEGSTEDRARLLEILDSHTRDKELIKEAIAILEKYDAVTYAKKRAREMLENAWSEAEKVLEDSEAKKTLESFMRYLIERDV
ncbi:MAG: polyprenyl synthetase family protein [Euryarchaeota archaeon]|nr:polyprenyl synthetase family protein [Euryarchaeota archaeon]